MASIETLIFFLISISIMLFYLGGYFYIQYQRGRREIIERIRHTGEEARSEESPGSFKTIEKPWTKFIKNLGNIVKPKKEGEVSQLRKKFLMAGYREESVIIMFSGFKAFLALLFAIGFLLIRFYLLKTMPSMQTMFFSVLFALIGFYLPNLWLSIRISRRKEKIQLGLPDALDLMVICVEAGTGLDAAINRIGEEMKLTNKILSEEFRILNLELRAGKQRRDALRNLSLRTGLEDVNSLVTLLIQTEQFGTSIGQALRVHSDSMRTKRYQRAEEIAQKMPVKLIFPLILFIFPTLLIIILGPAIISIIKTLTPILATAR
jgi:tight adherence protein C